MHTDDLISLPFGWSVLIRRYVGEGARLHIPDLADFFPFVHGTEEGFLRTETHLVLRVRSINGPDRGGTLEGSDRQFAESLAEGRVPLAEMKMNADWYSANTFTYVGRLVHGQVSKTDLFDAVDEWLYARVIPAVEKSNAERVRRALVAARQSEAMAGALSAGPSIDLEQLQAATFILESEAGSIQGTCFSLDGVGLVTCAHVLRQDTKLRTAADPAKQRSIEVVRVNEALDLAILRCPGLEASAVLPRGSAAGSKALSSVTLFGFPNYRIGDSGYVAVTFVAGDRAQSGVRRLLVNAGIIRGMSGCPVLDGSGRVIGVAVTGADRMDRLRETEDQSVTPIDALDLLE